MELKKGQKIYNSCEPYQHDVAILKNYNGKYKLTLHKTLKTKGLEIDRHYSPKGTVNDEKLDVNIIRAKSRIVELVLCNDWEWFFTITLDPKKYDRYDLEKFKKDFGQFVRDQRKKIKADIKYLVVPEEHSDGGWHMHGFLMGLNPSELRLFSLKEKLPYYILDKLKKGQEVYEWMAYRKKFGFNDFEKIHNQTAAAFYVTKYITKDLARTVKESGAHLYYCSQGLRRSEEVKRGSLSPSSSVSWQYENDYIATTWLDDSVDSEIMSLIKDNLILEHISINELRKQVKEENRYNRFLNGFDEVIEGENPFSDQ